MAIIVFVMVPSDEVGKDIAYHLVKNRFCSCVNIIGKAKSIYWWDDKIQEEDESLLLIKTKDELFNELEKEILKKHPYEVPEIVAIDMKKAHKPYIDWINKETK